ncbi:heme peroxidase [Mollisia scopiformis]|uniref:Peroxidase n=1 Tax=Mollisia scopiformis TaxID=149040 RepID=A0A194X202_MOLSC|nr:heme peroxidase [Mollisia scopiformis]KUJ14226.1 heme peroxidase [Mollisia scopiformis]
MPANMPTTTLLFIGAALLALSPATRATLFYPTVQASLLEHILVDTHGAHASGFADAITPCTNYVSGSQNEGRETAAQWLRVAFHDFVTAHVDEGTGGIDASIGFETLREEDSGTAFNDSFSFFRPYVSSKVSMADLVALSVTMSVGSCGGPQIPVRGGRIDATEAGPFGVPAPDTDLPTTLQYFANSGFNQVDSIGLTACGHTMGSVHHGGFPTVVGPQAVANNNIAGGIHFDSTVAVFDPVVVTEYLNSTGQAGGPLVTSFNVSSRSDLRLYESDNNATMIELAQQGEGFLHTCSTLLQRMVETVPSNVVLSDVVSPIEIKPINASLDFDATGNLIFTGYIRVLSSVAANAPTSLSISTSESQSVPLTAESTLGTNVFGVTTFFPFNVSITGPNSFESFKIQCPGREKTFSVKSSAFVVPSLSSSTSEATTVTNFTVAVSSSAPSYIKRSSKRDSTPGITVQAPVGQMGTLGPAILTFSDVTVTNIGSKAGYELWFGSVNVGTNVTGAVSIAALDSDGNELDILFV